MKELSMGRSAIRHLATACALGLLALGAEAIAPASAQAQDGGPSLTDSGVLNALTYRNIGPSRGGRVTTVAGHAAHPATFYMGPTGGGVWKTDDYGETWYPISDGYFETGSIGAIRVAPSDPNIVYVGTGSDGIRSNVIVGRGVYRSTNGGESWTHVGLRETGQIGAVEIHPTDPNTAWVAALGSPFGKNEERGVFRTQNGGATWEKVLFTSDSVGAIDLEIHPTNPDILYAAMWRGERKPWTIISGAASENGIYRSTDGGDTWDMVDLNIPQELTGKIDFAVSPDAPDRVLALVETFMPDEGLYISDDAGLSWRLLNNQRNLMDRPFYYTNVDIDPSDADIVYVSSTGMFKSTDGGHTFERMPTPHGDNHDIWVNPNDSNLLIQSNDGGANVSRDGGRTWSTQNNQPTAELYQVDIDDQFPYWIYAGQQDNSTVMVPSLPPAEASLAGPEGLWKDPGGCETGPVVPKPGDPMIVYSNCKGRFGRYSHRTGQEQQFYVGAVNLYGTNPADLPYRFQRVVPIEVSPHDPETVYHGSQFVHRTRDGGRNWETISPDLTAFEPERQMVSGGPITRDATGEEHYSTLYVIEESPVEAGVIWTGANDGPIHISRDNGASWTDVTPPDMPPEGRIQHIDPSPHSGGKAYIAGYRYLLNDFRPYIYKTEDYGQSWTLLTDGTNGIPSDYPTRVVREDPDREGLLYAGTEFGMFISIDDGANWHSFQQNLPVTPITDLRMKDRDVVISTMGRSFWIMDNVSLLHQLDAPQQAMETQLFRPEDAYRLRYGGGFGGFGGRNPAAPEFPQAGAMIDYYLASAPSGAVTMEILDAQGRTVAGFSSEQGGFEFEMVQEMREPQIVRSGGPRLGASVGSHRVIWDLRYAGVSGGGRGGSGPMAVPGSYQVRLNVDGESYTQPLRLHIDPRVEEDGISVEDLRAQHEFNATVQRLNMEANQTAQRINQAITDVRPIAENAGERASPARQALEDLEDLRMMFFDVEVGSYPQPMLLAQIRYLAGMTGRADQPPGSDAYNRLEELQSELERHVQRLNEILSRNIVQ